MSLADLEIGYNYKPKPLKCIVKVITSIYKTKSGSFVKKVELRDVKRKTQLLMSDIFGDYYYDVSSIENLEQVPDGEYELVPASIDYGTYEYPCEEVESSQVEDTSVPEFDWSTVEDDVEAVILSPLGKCKAVLKESGGKLWIKGQSLLNWYITRRADTINDYPVKQFQEGDGKIIRRPPATPPANKVGDQPIKCKVEFYEGTLPEGMVDLDKIGGEIQVEYVTLEKPSIQSILSDAQELIKKHHNITGEVKFTIKCS